MLVVALFSYGLPSKKRTVRVYGGNSRVNKGKRKVRFVQDGLEIGRRVRWRQFSMAYTGLLRHAGDYQRPRADMEGSLV